MATDTIRRYDERMRNHLELVRTWGRIYGLNRVALGGVLALGGCSSAGPAQPGDEQHVQAEAGVMQEASTVTPDASQDSSQEQHEAGPDAELEAGDVYQDSSQDMTETGVTVIQVPANQVLANICSDGGRIFAPGNPPCPCVVDSDCSRAGDLYCFISGDSGKPECYLAAALYCVSGSCALDRADSGTD